MIRINNVKLSLSYTDADIRKAVIKELRTDEKSIDSISLFRRSIDARHKNDVHFIATIDVKLNCDENKAVSKSKSKNVTIQEEYRYEIPYNKDLNTRPVVIGFGPAGMFASLILAKAGQRPIVIERGDKVDVRIKKVNNFWNNSKLNKSSNVQFGEGGAGTFSDGKLNTGTKDFRSRKVLLEFVSHGAPKEILYNAKPHIGTDKLRETVKNIREEIISLGGEVYFNTKLTAINHKNSKVCSVEVENGTSSKLIETDNVVLAIGHSARDTFEMLKSMNLFLEQKPFAVGVRIEHLRENIDKAQYGAFADSKHLGAADYKMNIRSKNGRGVFTFCMCPGGFVVAAQSEENTVVTNGMSNFARDNVNSNAALLVNVNPNDFGSDDVLAGVEFQRRIEKQAYICGGGDYSAPVQRVGDFLKKNKTTALGEVTPSYKPGTNFSKVDDYLPSYITDSMREGVLAMDRKLHGFAHPDAIITGAETRSSSPVRITRDDTMQSVTLKGLYPCGEGAGYAGGIISAAVDGIRCAEQILINA
ncbi:MAG: NAD(P)/FAD-dependent oxidoreductase [Ruminococcus sp.]|nr:NAD(P)/FAD-dependent oxidoreductase [Ruminococcus sp.]